MVNIGMFGTKTRLFWGPAAAETSMPTGLTFLLRAGRPKEAPRWAFGTLLGRHEPLCNLLGLVLLVQEAGKVLADTPERAEGSPRVAD